MNNAYLRHLANYVLIIQAGSMSQAAHQQGTSPSAMSESVKILENHCGQALLKRHRDGVTPTDCGLKVYESAKKMADAAEDALRKIDTKKGVETVKISLPGELASFWFKGVWQENYKHSQPTTISLLCEDLILDHERFTRDLFIRVSHAALPSSLNVLFEHVINVVHVAHPTLIAARDPNQPEELSDLPLICRTQKNGKAAIKLPTRDPKKSTVEYVFSKAFFVDEIQTRIALSRAGLGVVGCLEPSVCEEITSGELVRLAPDAFTIKVNVVIATPHKKPTQSTIQLANALSQWILDKTEPKPA